VALAVVEIGEEISEMGMGVDEN